MAMIKAAAESEEEPGSDTRKERGHGAKRQWGAQASQSSNYVEPGGAAGWITPKKQGWAAKGFEDLKDDSEEDGEQEQDSWTARKKGKGKGGKKY
eukprot:13414039-Heterocapsa_arctica.AAC.1